MRLTLDLALEDQFWGGCAAVNQEWPLRMLRQLLTLGVQEVSDNSRIRQR